MCIADHGHTIKYVAYTNPGYITNTGKESSSNCTSAAESKSVSLSFDKSIHESIQKALTEGSQRHPLRPIQTRESIQRIHKGSHKKALIKGPAQNSLQAVF